jgi:hypothetical protein
MESFIVHTMYTECYLGVKIMEDLVGGEYSIHAMDEAFVHAVIEKREGKRLRERHRRRWKDTLKIILKGKGFERHCERVDGLGCPMKGVDFLGELQATHRRPGFPPSVGCLCQCFT